MKNTTMKSMRQATGLLACATLAAALVGGCTKDVAVMNTERDADCPVLITPSFGDYELTRTTDGDLNPTTGFSLLYSANSASQATIKVDDGSDGSDSYTNYTYNVTAAKELAVSGTAPQFPAGVNTVHVYGWYPATASGGKSFQIKADQSGKDGYCLSDLMLANKANCTRSGSNGDWTVTAAALNFRHVMSRVKLTVKPTGVTVKKVVLKSMKTDATISTSDLSGLSATASGTSTDDITLYKEGSSTSNVTCYGVFPAQSKSGDFIEITATVSGSDKTFTYSLGSTAKTFNSSQQYDISITLKATQTQTSVDISEWNPASNTSVEIGTGGGIEFNTTANTNGYITIGDIASRIYTGNAITPTPTVQMYISGTTITLRKDVDYEITYLNNTNIGIARLKVTGKDFFTGSVFKQFNIIALPDGALSGKFTINNEDKEVYFSKGNLQLVGKNTWQFAEHQYDYFGSNQYDNNRDLFGWGTKDTPNNTSTDYSSYSWKEWGENLVSALEDNWRTLTKDEWTYVFNTRSASTIGTTANARYAMAKVNDVHGVILFPDVYTHPDDVNTPTDINAENVAYDNCYSVSVDDWAMMESAGAVFLPAAGFRDWTMVDGIGDFGGYWSSTDYSTDNAYLVRFYSGYLNPASYERRSTGYSVRLVFAVE